MTVWSSGLKQFLLHALKNNYLMFKPPRQPGGQLASRIKDSGGIPQRIHEELTRLDGKEG